MTIKNFHQVNRVNKTENSIPKKYEATQFEKEILPAIKDKKNKEIIENAFQKENDKYILIDEIEKDDKQLKAITEILEPISNNNLKKKLEEQIDDGAIEELTVIRQNLIEKDDQVKELTQKLTEYDNILKRKQAEFENYRKRTIKERDEFQVTANSKLIENLLPILDNFEKAIESANTDQSDVSVLHDGILLIEKQMKKLLENYQVEAIDSVGKEFDPNYHEAIQIDESNTDHEHDTVITEWQKGYLLGSKVLRHSKVVVAKGRGEQNWYYSYGFYFNFREK